MERNQAVCWCVGVLAALALPWFIGGMINAERKDMPYSYHVPAGSM